MSARDETVRYVEASLAALVSGEMNLDGFRLAMLSVAKGQVHFEPHDIAVLNSVASAVHFRRQWESARTNKADAHEVAFVLSTLYRLADLSDHALNGFAQVVEFYSAHLVAHVLATNSTNLWSYIDSCGAPNDHQVVLLKRFSSFIADLATTDSPYALSKCPVQPLSRMAVSYPEILDERWRGYLAP